LLDCSAAPPICRIATDAYVAETQQKVCASFTGILGKAS
jgi:hypothetical protein